MTFSFVALLPNDPTANGSFEHFGLRHKVQQRFLVLNDGG